MDEGSARDDELGGASVATDVAARANPVGSQIEAAAAAAGTSGTEPQRRRWVTPLLAALAVVGLASAATFGALYFGSDVQAQDVGEFLAGERADAAETAGRVADLLLNYDSTNLEDVSEEMLTLSTGNFREQYEEVLSSGGGLGTALEEASASSRGQLLEDPDVSFRSGSEAIAIMRVQQTTQSNSNPEGRTFDYILKITLVDTTDGGWKADRVEILSTSGG